MLESLVVIRYANRCADSLGSSNRPEALLASTIQPGASKTACPISWAKVLSTSAFGMPFRPPGHRDHRCVGRTGIVFKILTNGVPSLVVPTSPVFHERSKTMPLIFRPVMSLQNCRGLRRWHRPTNCWRARAATSFTSCFLKRRALRFTMPVVECQTGIHNPPRTFAIHPDHDMPASSRMSGGKTASFDEARQRRCPAIRQAFSNQFVLWAAFPIASMRDQ